MHAAPIVPPEKVSRIFGCTVEQARDGMLRTAADLRGMTDKQVKRSGYSREYLNARADAFDAAAKAGAL